MDSKKDIDTPQMFFNSFNSLNSDSYGINWGRKNYGLPKIAWGSVFAFQPQALRGDLCLNQGICNHFQTASPILDILLGIISWPATIQLLWTPQYDTLYEWGFLFLRNILFLRVFSYHFVNLCCVCYLKFHSRNFVKLRRSDIIFVIH